MIFDSLPLAGMVAAVAVPLLVVLYFLKLRRISQSVSSTLLWQKSIQDLRANAPFQKLRRNILLFLQLLALLAVIAAIARPGMKGVSSDSQRIVLMLDRSRSMNTIDPGGEKTRLELAKEAAVKLVEALPEPNIFSGSIGRKPPTVMVIAFAEQAKLISNFTTDKKQLIRRIREITPTDGRTNIGSALTLSRAYNHSVESETRGQLIEDPPAIELFTDGLIKDLSDQVLEGETITFHMIGNEETDANLAVTAMDASRVYDRPTELAVYTTVSNFSLEEKTTDVQMSLDGAPLQIVTVTIPAARPNESTGEIMPGNRGISFSIASMTTGGTLEVRILRKDVLSSDNAGVLVVPPPKRAHVAYVTDDPTMPLALKSLPITADKITLQDLNKLNSSGKITSYDVIIIDGVVPAEKLTRGSFITFGKPPLIDGLGDEGEEKATFPTTWDRKHPVMRNVNLDDIPVDIYHRLKITDDMHVILEGSSGPLAVSISRGDLQAIVFAFRPIDSYWPLDPSYVVFFADAIRYLSDRGQAVSAEPLSPGEAISLRLPTDATNIKLQMPGKGKTVSYHTAEKGLVVYGPIEKCGLYKISYKSGKNTRFRYIAADLFDTEECRVAAVPALKLARKEITATGSSDIKTHKPLWKWGMLAALLILLFEWWVYNRRAYI